MSIYTPDLNTDDQQTAQTLTVAARTGDLTTIREILSTWPIQPGSEPAPSPGDPGLWPFNLVLIRAIEENKSHIVSYVLGTGLNLGTLAIRTALDNKSSIETFQVFFENGWDINAPLGEIEPPALAYVLPQSSRSLMLSHVFRHSCVSHRITPFSYICLPISSAMC